MKINLRTVIEEDIECWVKYLNNKNIYDNTYAIPYPYYRQDGEGFFRQLQNDDKKIFWTIEYEGKCVGAISLTNISNCRAELGYWLAEEFWQKGIMTEAVKKVTNFAFTKLSLQRVEAVVFDFNISSKKLLEKCGFGCEGLLKSYLKKGDKIIDTYMFARVKS